MDRKASQGTNGAGSEDGCFPDGAEGGCGN